MYDGHMKVFFLAAAALVAASAAGVDDVKTVYLLPMSNALDQFLAMRLTHGAVMQVVTDPQKADAIFTDRIGVSFEQKLDELYGAQDKGKEGKVTGMQVGTSRGRGAIFLVDRKTRNVIWTDYEKPGGTAPSDMNRTAERIADKLQKEIKPKSN
jgi:hypothetical protein